MPARFKLITMTVTVSVPVGVSAAEARREVRTLINERSYTLEAVPARWSIMTVKSCKPAPKKGRRK